MYALPERLEKLRKGRTKNEIAEGIQKKTKTGITAQTYGRYEKVGKGSRKPDSEMLYALAIFFGVSSDYLLGLSDYDTPDLKNQAICNHTGLSPKSVNLLKNLKNKQIISIINYILEEYADKNEFSILGRIIEFISIDTFSTNKGDYYINKSGELRTPKAMSAEADFKDFVKLKAVDIGGAIQELLLNNVKTALIKAKDNLIK